MASNSLGSIKECKYWIWKIPDFYSVTSAENILLYNNKWSIKYSRKTHKEASQDLLNIHLKLLKQEYSPDLEVCTFVQDILQDPHFIQKTIIKSNQSRSDNCIWQVNRDTFLENEYLVNGISDTVTIVCVFGPIGEIINGCSKGLSEKCETNLSFERLSLDFSSMLEGDSYADVTLKCNGQSFSAHKNILSARSPVFAAMFKHDMMEKRDGVVEIPDIDADIFLPFLKFIYAGELKSLTQDTAVLLYKAGDKYEIDTLKKECVNYIVNKLTPENVCDYLILADSHCDKVFKQSLLLYLKKESRNVLKLDSFKRLRSDNLTLALKVYDACHD